jgi:hypothetical protein
MFFGTRETMKLSLGPKILLTFLVLGSLLGFAATPYFCVPAANSAYFALTLIGIAIICLRLTPSWRTVLWALLAGASISAEVDFFVHPFSPVAWVSSFGFGSLLVLGAQAVWTNGEERDRILWGFAGASVLVASEYFGLNLLHLTEDPSAKVLDLYLFSFDNSLHVPLGFLMGQAFQKWLWLHLVGLFCYVGLFIPMAVVFAGHLVRDRKKALEALAAFIVAAPLGVFFYRLCPAVGPIYVLSGNFPWHPLSYSDASRLFLEPISSDALRNAMPSLHMTWALLAWWCSRGLSRWERAVPMFFATFTVVSTLGSGEHYLVDLIVAFPFALMIQHLCTFSLPWSGEQRRRAFLFGLLTTLAWIAVLRYEPRVFWISPVIPWAAAILTVGLSISSLRSPWHVAPAASSAIVSSDAPQRA